MYNMYCFVHNIKNSRRNDHFFPAKVSPKSQKSSKKAYLLLCCGAAVKVSMRSIVRRRRIDRMSGNYITTVRNNNLGHLYL